MQGLCGVSQERYTLISILRLVAVCLSVDFVPSHFWKPARPPPPPHTHTPAPPTKCWAPCSSASPPVLKPGTSLTLTSSQTPVIASGGSCNPTPPPPPPKKKLPKKQSVPCCTAGKGKSFPILLLIKNLSFAFYEIKKLIKK